VGKQFVARYGWDLAFELPANLVHVMCHYHRQWIPGDQRGFRSREHRIHSSGDYRHPPPPDEHERLRYHVQSRMNGKPVRLTTSQSAEVGAAFVCKLQKMDCTVIILSCGPTHVHALLSASEQDVEKQVGKAKQFASLKCSGHSGQLWGAGCAIGAVENIRHARRVFAYIRDHEKKERAWIWRFDRTPRPSNPEPPRRV
jgi:REP element-mobilizing transposase RayT